MTEMLTIITVVLVFILNIEFLGKGVAELSGATLLFYRCMTVIARMQGIVQSLISSHGFFLRIEGRAKQADLRLKLFTGKKL